MTTAIRLDVTLPRDATHLPLAVLRLHSEADAVPAMLPDEYEAFVADVEQRGITTPLTVTPLGVVLDGRHRYQAAGLMGIEYVPVYVADVPELGQVEYMVRQALLRRHLTIDQRREMAAGLLRENPERSDRQVAGIVGLSHPTVATVRDELEAAGDVEEVSTRTDTLGRQQPTRPKWNPGAAIMSSDTPEWYTPRHVVDAVARTLRTIDLDPCAEAERRVPAVRHLTEADDGLGREWAGRVYMNPPYGRSIGDWTTKLRTEFDSGRVSEAVALLPARTETDWWAALRAEFVCFIHGRLAFSDGAASAPFPSAALYLGSEGDRFTETFADLGPVYRRVAP